MVVQWSAVAIVAALWMFYVREPSLLWLAMPSGWRLWTGLGAVVGVALLMTAQAVSASRADDDLRTELRPRLGYAIPILPRTVAERRWFMGLSLTAGICEELIYRGYVLWALTPWLGLWGAAVGSVAGFGIAHAYLGREGVVRATIAGAVFAVAVVGLHSLYPAMILHAALDVGAGAVGYVLLRDATGA
ncbi:MAG TPA: CPBP family intramembrane glutamic endopeptidase [Gemmatimonadaceae bacterium]|nr:CPBP family intramembrane glutamic endopeptidase [Gemmatimonadaceae bacterium]